MTDPLKQNLDAGVTKQPCFGALNTLYTSTESRTD